MSTDLPAGINLTSIAKDITGEYWIEALNNGIHVLIRPLKQEDRQREFQFIKHLSPETRRARFLGTMSGASTELLDQMMDLDNRDRMAYVALVHHDGELIEVGVSRYAPGEEPRECECAVVVTDDWQRLGLGQLLMSHLINAAKRNGFEKMTSIDLANDYGMHRLAKRMGFTSRYQAKEFTEIIHDLDLTQA
ncbi:MAG: GNAT family N-acetyltransferase [Pseudomonas sp.]